MSTSDETFCGFTPSPHSLKPRRILACVRCQQRKIKCDRTFPCAHCNTAHVQCVPATRSPRVQRRRRFPERALLDQLHKYEELLRENNIKFEPLHKDFAIKKESPEAANESDSEQPEPEALSPSSTSANDKSEKLYEANLLRALTSSHGDQESDDDSSEDHEIRDVVSKRSWHNFFGVNDDLLFGSHSSKVDLSSLHPEPAYIFRLWQIYLDNVDPLLKVTHTPSMQRHIVDAASNVRSISPPLEALIFAIYCMALSSLAVKGECEAIFGSSKKDLLTRFHFGCQQALLNCNFLQTSDRDCLTALYLYLRSIEPDTAPRAITSLLGIAIRVAQRMRIHSESALAKCTVFEAEMRRRLWWSLVLFDARISEKSNHECTALNPTWDCKIPLNINDSDIRPEMKDPPAAKKQTTDMLFVVVHSELGQFIRHSSFHLEFTSPALKPTVNSFQQDVLSEVTSLESLEKRIEEKYLSSCDQENPIHFLTTWFARLTMARCGLLASLEKRNKSPLPQTEAQRAASYSYCLRMLECDTKLASSPLTKGLMWMPILYFPFIAYVLILQELRIRPVSEQAMHAWEVMSANYLGHVMLLDLVEVYSAYQSIFIKILQLAWEAREAAFRDSKDPMPLPAIVASIKEWEAKVRGRTLNAENGPIQNPLSAEMDDFSVPKYMDFDDYGLFGGVSGQNDFLGADLGSDLSQLNQAAWDTAYGSTSGFGEFPGS